MHEAESQNRHIVQVHIPAECTSITDRPQSFSSDKGEANKSANVATDEYPIERIGLLLHLKSKVYIILGKSSTSEHKSAAVKVTVVRTVYHR